MSILNILLIAIALSLDAAAVSAANGARHHQMSFLKAVKIAFFFGFFQLFMPLVGWMFGSGLEQLIAGLDHWVAFVLLGILGIKMFLESLKPVEEKQIDIHSWKILLLLSVATSIDALVVGISFAFISMNIWFAVLMIGVVTFALSLISIYIGKKCGERWGKKAEMLGGIILFGIGLKILLTHLLG